MKHFLLLPIALALASPVCFAKMAPQIDYAVDQSKTWHVSASGNTTVKVVNLAPGNRYVIQTDHKVATVPAFDRDAFEDLRPQQAAAPDGGAAPLTSNPCEDLWKVTKALTNAKDETTIPQIIAAVEDEIIAADDGPECREYRQAARNAIALTEREVEITLKSNYTAIITIRRNDQAEADARTYIFKAPESNQWITTYGLGFISSRDKHYHSVADSTNGGFTVQQQADRSDFTYSAQVLFTYPTNIGMGDHIKLGVTGGFGASEESISGLVGVSAVVNQNLVLTLGMSMQETATLKGTYEVGQNIGTEHLDSSVLGDKTYKPSMAFVISFRFE